jgi:hypothetical protein
VLVYVLVPTFDKYKFLFPYNHISRECDVLPRYHVAPTIPRLRERLASDEGGELAFDPRVRSLLEGQTSVAEYMAKRRRSPSQGGRTFVRNHVDGIASIDLFVVPTISFRLLYCLPIVRHDRREISCLNGTAHPTAEWMARQLTEAFGWESAPKYLIRDPDSIYGEKFKRRVRAMGIRDRPTVLRSPWQNGHTGMFGCRPRATDRARAISRLRPKNSVIEPATRHLRPSHG